MSIMINAADDTRITILRLDDLDVSLIQLGQYQFQSISALEQKLAQYLRGWSFMLDTRALGSQVPSAVISEILTFAGAHGIAIDQER